MYIINKIQKIKASIHSFIRTIKNMPTIQAVLTTVLAATGERTIFEDNNFQPCETKTTCNLWKQKNVVVDTTTDLTIVMIRAVTL